MPGICPCRRKVDYLFIVPVACSGFNLQAQKIPGPAAWICQAGFNLKDLAGEKMLPGVLDRAFQSVQQKAREQVAQEYCQDDEYKKTFNQYMSPGQGDGQYYQRCQDQKYNAHFPPAGAVPGHGPGIMFPALTTKAVSADRYCDQFNQLNSLFSGVKTRPGIIRTGGSLLPFLDISGERYLFQDFGDNSMDLAVLSFIAHIYHQAVSKHRLRQHPDIIRQDEVPAFYQRPGL
jgi:hypothetical protein